MKPFFNMNAANPGALGLQVIREIRKDSGADRTRMKKLIADGADINVKDENGVTALMHAVMQNDRTAFGVLIAANVNLSITDRSGYTAVMFAAAWDRRDLLLSLMQKGQEIDLQSPQGRKVMQIAREQDYEDIVLILERQEKKRQHAAIDLKRGLPITRAVTPLKMIQTARRRKP